MKFAMSTTPLRSIRIDDLPLSNIAREFVGADHGDVGVCVILVDAPPGRGPSLHRHPYEEVFITLEGQATFFLGEDGTNATSDRARSSSFPPGSGTGS